MDNKIVKVIIAIVVVSLLAFVILWQPAPRPPTVLEMKMIPIDGCPGEFILEYSNGRREHLKKDGTRVPIPPEQIKD